MCGVEAPLYALSLLGAGGHDERLVAGGVLVGLLKVQPASVCECLVWQDSIPERPRP